MAFIEPMHPNEPNTCITYFRLLFADCFAKVYLLQNGRKVSKKKTTVKRDAKNPIFNEAMIFSVPANALQVWDSQPFFNINIVFAGTKRRRSRDRLIFIIRIEKMVRHNILNILL